MVLNIAHLDHFFYHLLLHLFILHLSKLAVVGVLEDKVDFNELKNRQHSCTFLKSLKHSLHTIPDDCREGLKELDTLLGKRLNWNQDILPNWGLRRAA